MRDLLLGREPKDFDIATDATPGEIKKLFRNCRLIGRRFRLAHVHFHDEIIEVATFRSMVSDELEAVETAHAEPPLATQPSEPRMQEATVPAAAASQVTVTPEHLVGLLPFAEHE